MKLIFEHERRYINKRPAVKVDDRHNVGPAKHVPDEVCVVIEMSMPHSPTLIDWDKSKKTAFGHKHRYEWRIRSLSFSSTKEVTSPTTLANFDTSSLTTTNHEAQCQ